MHLRIFLVVFCGLALMSFARAGEAPLPFKISIVPSRSSASERTIAMADDKPDAFHVVLTLNHW